MNKKNMLLGLALVLSIALWSPAAILAGEHGGSEHGGAEMEGSHGYAASGSASAEDQVATLKEAAAALEASNPELARKLEEMAKEMQ